MGYQKHREKEDSAEIVYPCQDVQKNCGPSRRNTVIEELKTFINSEVPKEKPKSSKKTAKKRNKRSHGGGDRSMLIVFLDEIDQLISKAKSTFYHLIYLTLFPEYGYDFEAILHGSKESTFDSDRRCQLFDVDGEMDVRV